MEKIGFGPRFLAALIDGVILFGVAMVLGLILGGGASAFSGGGSYIAGLVVSLFSLGYTSLEIFKAATPGKMIMKIAIRNADGSVAPQEVLIKRWAIKSSGSLVHTVSAITTIALIGHIGMLFGLVILVGCFFVLGADKLALHDKIAGTAVYKV